ncbi:MAG: alpha/beta fold hydrolase [Deltaproteobacteria bacterium]|jgi:pimeloyl-ACP methyl ester carboxylesterase|nr:alpha/beta fold hydrolase [Deltaproteobacteria bacterium]MBW2533470.1 alpha/beta fold hydrolase [Deltaproteobacteria bacterium]
MEASDQRTIETPDGWRLELRRLGASSARRATPVLMLHGFGANSFCLANRHGPSLGHYLATRGADVWLLDFRGTQSSWHPDGSAAFARISVDDKILVDLPTAVSAVLAETQQPSLDLLGFSLGGTIAYGYLSQHGQSAVRRVVTLAAPLRFELPLALRLLLRLPTRRWGPGRMPRRLPLRGFTRLGARTRIVLPARDHFNLANVDRSVLLAMMRDGAEDAATGELSQLARWSVQGRLTSLDGAIDFGSRVGELARPLLVLGAAADRHVRAEHLVSLLTTVASPQKRLVVVGRQSGAQMDYGHTDLLLGRHAAIDVFPHVDEWLAEPSSTSPGDEDS